MTLLIEDFGTQITSQNKSLHPNCYKHMKTFGFTAAHRHTFLTMEAKGRHYKLLLDLIRDWTANPASMILFCSRQQTSDYPLVNKSFGPTNHFLAST